MSIIREHGLETTAVEITAAGLDPEQAIGNPDRDDYPLLRGEEVMIQAEFRGHRGQAFTDHPGEFAGPLEEVLALPPDSNFHRALLVASMNAVLRSLGRVEKTVHCRDGEMARCVQKMLEWLGENRPGTDVVGIVGYQPALLEALAGTLGADRVRITDLHPERVGTVSYGVEVWDGETDSGRLIRASDFLFITGSTVTNATIDGLLSSIEEHGRDYRLYGNTISGIAHLLELPQLCFYGR